MNNSNNFVKENTPYLNTIFIFFLIIYFVLGQMLIWKIPFSFPFGGPDELMHLSMADYISQHLSWPRWDSTEVVRNGYGVSYSAGGSIVYWLHGLTYKLFGYHRMGAFLLLVVYLLLAIVLYRKNKLAGFLLLAGLFPQTLFIFSYVNSDSGTIITAILLGMSVGLFVTGEDKIKYFLILLFFAGLAVTARQHLWAIAFLTLVWALVYKRKTLYQCDKKIWILAFFLGLLPASWWFTTSFFANDGDILGIFTTSKSIIKFGNPDLPSLARAWSDISITDFMVSTLTSLYASWGWMSLQLETYEYIAVSVIVLPIIILLYQHIDKKIFVFFILLLATNFGFMLLYSTFYDYQAQGRYLFPSIYIILGMLTTIVLNKKVFSKTLLSLLIILGAQNVYFSTKLTFTSYMDVFLKKPVLTNAISEEYYAHAQFHLDQLQIIDGKLLIRGWIFDTKNGKSFNSIKLVLKTENKFYTVDLDTEKRPDVATVFKNNNLRSSGFSGKMIDFRELKKGTYHYLLSVEVDNKEMLIDINQSLKI
jgi:hypothetical protein